MLFRSDLMGGQVQAYFAGVSSSAPHIRAGRARALGVTTVTRSNALPDVPTIAESGVAGYEVDGWYGLLAPGATPGPVISRLNADLVAALSIAEVKERLMASGLDARPSTPAAFHQRISSEIVRWADIVKRANIALDP